MSLCGETCSFLQSKSKRKQEVHCLPKARPGRSLLTLVWQERRQLWAPWVCRTGAGWICGALVSLGAVPCRWPVPVWKFSVGDKAQEGATEGRPSWWCALQAGVPVASACRRKLGYTGPLSSRTRHSSGMDSHGASSPFQPVCTHFQLCLGCKCWRKRPLECDATNFFGKGKSLETVRWPKVTACTFLWGMGKTCIQACYCPHKNILLSLLVSLHLCQLLALPLDTSIGRGFVSPPFKVL